MSVDFSLIERMKLTELGKGISSKTHFFPKEELHHSDCSGKGLAETSVIRFEHNLIHESGKDGISCVGERNGGGFYGDTSTRKFGNKVYGKSEDSVKFIFYETMETIHSNSFDAKNIYLNSWDVDYLKKYDLKQSFDSKKYYNTGLNKNTFQIEPVNDFTPVLPSGFSWFHKSVEPVEPVEPVNNFLTFSKSNFLSDNLINIRQLSSPYAEPNKEIQDHWSGKNYGLLSDSVQQTISKNYPSLQPSFEREDSYLTTQHDATKSFNDLIVRTTKARATFDNWTNLSEQDSLKEMRQKNYVDLPNGISYEKPTGGW